VKKLIKNGRERMKKDNPNFMKAALHQSERPLVGRKRAATKASSVERLPTLSKRIQSN
jgi:hypothetical protein